MAVGVWNFVGAGVFGFLINLPIVSYFEVGTTLTPNHGHAAMFGVFGMLALAVLVFCLRALKSDGPGSGSEKLVRVGFWGLNIGLGLMVLWISSRPASSSSGTSSPTATGTPGA